MNVKTIYKNDPDWNRIKVISVGREFLTDLLFGSVDYIVRTNLPEDARIEDVKWDNMSYSFKLVIKSKEFPERQEGECLESIKDGIWLEDVKTYYNRQLNKLIE